MTCDSTENNSSVNGMQTDKNNTDFKYENFTDFEDISFKFSLEWDFTLTTFKEDKDFNI